MRLEGAACAGHPELPPETWDSRLHGEEPEERRARLKAARAVCAACPVADRCEDAGVIGYGGGVRNGHAFPDRVSGGYKVDDRDVGRPTLSGRQRPPCGSPGGRKAHLKRGEDVCDPCDEAARAANRERMALRRQADRETDVA